MRSAAKILGSRGLDFNRIFFDRYVKKFDMTNRLPSLNALRAFVTVARYGGVSRAAEALNLTHSAVSHHIRALQEELGVALFNKAGRGLSLTAEGSRFAARVEAAFSEIDDAACEISHKRHKRLNITTISSFAACWLLPRLGDFIASCSDIDVEVHSTNTPTVLAGGEGDVRIGFGTGPFHGLFSELLLRDWLFPVCSPEFARQYGLRDGVWNHNAPLMRSSYEPWSRWLVAAGIDVPDNEHGILFDNSALILQAAIKGQGLGLVRHSLAHDDLVAGRLVRPFSAYVESPMSYYFLCREERLESPPVARFREWIKAQIAIFPAEVETRQ